MIIIQMMKNVDTETMIIIFDCDSLFSIVVLAFKIVIVFTIVGIVVVVFAIVGIVVIVIFGRVVLKCGNVVGLLVIGGK